MPHLILYRCALLLSSLAHSVGLRTSRPISMLARAPAPPPPLPPPRPVVLSGPSSRLDRTCTSCPLCRIFVWSLYCKPTYRDPLSFSSLGYIALRFHFSSASPRAMDPSWQADARRAVRMGLLAERSIHALLPPAGLAEADAGLPSTGASAPLAAPQVLTSSTPARPPRPPRWPVRAPSLWEPGNAGYSPRPVGCGADGRSPLRVRPQRARVCRVPRAALASAHIGHPSARARPAPHTLPVRADPDRYRPAPPRLAMGASGAATLASTNRGIAGGTPSPRARAGSGPPPARPRLPSSRTSLPRGGRGPSRSRSVRRTPNTMATPSKPGLTPKRAARPPYGGHASRSTGISVKCGICWDDPQRQGQARACNTHHLS